MDDISNDGMKMLSEIVEIFENYGFETEIIAASIRHPMHVLNVALIGVDIVTMPFDVLEKLFKHPMTDIGIKKFSQDWENYIKKIKS